MDCVATFGKYNGFKSIVPKGVEQERKPDADIAKEFANGIMNLMGVNANIECKYRTYDRLPTQSTM